MNAMVVRSPGGDRYAGQFAATKRAKSGSDGTNIPGRGRTNMRDQSLPGMGPAPLSQGTGEQFA